MFKIFKISKLENGSFRYIGLNIVKTGDEVYVDQDKYIKLTH